MSTVQVPTDPHSLAVEVTMIGGGQLWPVVGLALDLQPGGGLVVDDLTVRTPGGAVLALSELDGHRGIVGVGAIVSAREPSE